MGCISFSFFFYKVVLPQPPRKPHPAPKAKEAVAVKVAHDRAPDASSEVATLFAPVDALSITCPRDASLSV